MTENENLNGSIDLISSDGTRTTENGKNVNHSDTAAVPDVLLSFIKDGRYLKSLVHLLSQALAPWLIDITRQHNATTYPATNQSEDLDIMDENNLNTNNRWISIVKPELELFAGIIYFIFTILPRGRTLGMEYVGIEYFFCDRNSKSGSRFDAKKILSRFNNRKFKNIHQTKEDSYFLRSMGNSRLRMMAFSFVYVVVPYLIRRVGKEGGWSRLKEFLTFLLHQRGEQRSMNHLHEEEASSRINESLRGIARRRVYENQRRAMLARIERMERQAQEQDEGIDHEQNQDHNPHSNRNMDEAQQNMNSSLQLNLNQLNNYSLNYRLGLCLRKARHLLFTLFQHLSIIEEQELRASTNAQALSIPVTAENDVQTANTSNSSIYNHFTSSLKWFLRLHLALYFLNSRYPTFMSHRLLSIKMKSGGAPLVSQALSSQSPSQTYHNTIIRPSYRVLGLLLVVQSLAGLLKGGTKICMNALYRMQIYNNVRMRRRILRQRENNDQDHIEELKQDEEGDSFLVSVERIVPSLDSSVYTSADDSITPSSNFVRSISDINNNSSATARCALCMSERKSPAIAPCGHVFCWKCIQHWCTNVRPECPLCRKPTLPQSVLALYGYK